MSTHQTADRPLVSMLLICYRQRQFVADAVRGALAQTYAPLEILISDDGSDDGTFEAIQDAVSGYAGPHRVSVHRNETNIGIGAHLSRLAMRSAGELMFVAAGDDISLPTRCEEVVAVWLRHGRRPDLIATDLLDMAFDGGALLGTIAPDDLGEFRSFDDWARRRPYVVGAAHAWSRRLFDRFGPLDAPQMSSEDLIMTFRAIVSGGAISLRRPLVKYRRGGLSRGARTRTPADFVARLCRGNRSALAETALLLHDAGVAGLLPEMMRAVAKRRWRELYIRDLFAAAGLGARLRLLFGPGRLDPGFRLRMFLYAACPWVYAPFYWLRRR